MAMKGRSRRIDHRMATESKGDAEQGASTMEQVGLDVEDIMKLTIIKS